MIFPKACLPVHSSNNFIKLFRTSGESVRGSGNFKERIRQWKWAIIQPNFIPPPLHISELALRLRTENFDDTVSRRFYASSWSRSRDQLNLGREGAAGGYVPSLQLSTRYLTLNTTKKRNRTQPLEGNLHRHAESRKEDQYVFCMRGLALGSKSGGLRGFRARGYWA